jgi:hypothetical protein
MHTKTKLLSISTLVSATLFLTLSAAQASVERTQAPNGATTTKIKVNGQFAELFLIDGNTHGALVVTKDQVTNTSAIDFSYATPDPTNPDQVILTQGAGAIPNSTFTITSTTAHLMVTVSNSASFLINHCIINTVTGSFDCSSLGTPKSFNLTWVVDGLGTVDETTKRVETMGPVTTKFKGTFTIETANVNGTWG